MDFGASYDKLSITQTVFTGGQATLASRLGPDFAGLSGLSVVSQIAAWGLDMKGAYEGGKEV